MLRERDCAPVPHDLVQVDQALKADTTQWPAQACSLHVRTWRRYGHFLPPKLAGLLTLRIFHCVPAPHDLVQPVQGPKASTLQSTGHSRVLHARCSLRYGQA